MIRHFLLKLCAGVAVCSVLLVTCVFVAGYFAFQSPRFYSEVLEKPSRVDEADAAKLRLENVRREFLQWRARSHVIHQHHAVAALDNGLGNPNEAGAGIVSRHDEYTFRISDDDVNALLATEMSSLGSGDVRDPRIRFDEGQIELALTLVTPAGDMVLSAGFVPRPPADDAVRFQVAEARLGRMPFPVSTISRLLAKREWQLSGELSLDATGSFPELVLRMEGSEQDGTHPKSIECANGEIVVRLVASP